MSSFKIGQRVEVIGKDVQGVIAFHGPTNFASGKWIGLKLDEPKGKNNGSVQGHVYFQVKLRVYEPEQGTYTLQNFVVRGELRIVCAIHASCTAR